MKRRITKQLLSAMLKSVLCIQRPQPSSFKAQLSWLMILVMVCNAAIGPMTGGATQEATRGDPVASNSLLPKRDAQGPRATPAPGSSQIVNSTPVTTVSAASYEATAAAPESIVAAFGTSLATSTQAANTIPLPTSLAGTTVTVTDSLGTERMASLFYVSPGQINYQIPPGTAVGKAIVTVQAGDGTISQGTAEVREVAPALFTANSDGQGVAAAVALRVKANGDQVYESIHQPGPLPGRFITKPIDLGPPGESVFLILFLSGIRGVADTDDDKNRNENIRLVMGGEDAVPSFAGPQPDFVGLDQVNAEIPRSLIGRGRVNFAISANGFTSSNLGEVEIGPASGTSPPEVNGFSPASVLAGQTLTVTGNGFSSNLKENLVRIGGVEASVISATPTQLSVVVPFGVEIGVVSVRASGNEGVSKSALIVRTSISGFIENTARSPMSGVTVKLVGMNIAATTNPEGAFILPDVPTGETKLIEIDGAAAAPTALYPKVILRVNVSAGRDNQLGPIALRQVTGAGIAIGSAGTRANESISVPVSSGERESLVAQTSNVVLDLPAGATVRFPDGSASDALNLTPIENGKTPISLPPGHFNSTIVQITPFGATINPGGKLTFPNLDGFPAGAQTKLFRFDQTANSPTLGSFVEEGVAMVSSDGQQIETPAGAIKETGCYFVSISWPTTTVTGRVVEGDGTPVRRAVARSRGQEAFTDGRGSFILRHVPIKQGEQLTVEAGFMRPTSRVDREEGKSLTVNPGEVTYVRPDVVLPSDSSNRGPVILAPTSLCATAGQSLDVNFVVSDPDPSPTIQVGVTGASFASIAPGADPKVLRLTPGVSDDNNYTLTLTATDGAIEGKPHEISLNVSLPLRVISITPQRAGVFETLTIIGEGFDDREPARNAVRFPRVGGGQTVAKVTAATRTQLTVIVPVDAVTGPISVRTACNIASSQNNFELISPPPTITSFSPGSAPVGASIEITGRNFAAPSGAGPQVAINKQGGGTLAATVTSFGPNNISFTVPTGAGSGPLIVTVAGQNATSTAVLNIVASNDFTLTTAPNTADVIQGQSISYAVTLASGNGFSQLAALSVTGLPSGVTASFKPQQITAGQMSVLTVTTPSGQTPSSATLTVSASATVEGIALNQSSTVSLNIKPITTSFLGRTVVANTLQTPLAGVTVKFLGKNSNGDPTNCSGQTVSDAAGNFAFTNLPAGCAGEQLIRYDGLTAIAPPGKYAGVDLVYNIVANQVTVSPVLVHLPRIDDKETVMVQQNAPTDQTFQFRSIPGLSVTVYAGTTFTLVDGTRPNPFPLTAVQVPVDRLPEAKPPNPQMMMVFIVAFQPANATASQPVPVFYPNTINTPPGRNMALMTLDPTKGTMVPYGTGTVSNDGVQVVPDFNPATPGKRYGLVHFDWHGQMPIPPPAVNPGCPTIGSSIDLSSGLEVRNETDIAISGLRGGISIQRVYRTLSNEAGPFGVGTGHNYSYRLDTVNPQAAALINLIMPDGNRFPFIQGTPRTLTNSTIPGMIGARMIVLGNNQVDLRWKDGTVFHFVPANPQLGSVLESITDPNGNKITLVRNASALAQITEVVDPVGRKLLLSYDAANRITSITDPIGRTVAYTYNTQGTLATMTDHEGGVTRYDYDAQNRLTQITDARGIVVARLTYGVFGRVVEEVQADGGRLQLAYTFINPLAPTSPVAQTVVTDARGNRTTYRFNTQGFLTDVTDAFGQTRVFEREPGTNLLLSIKGPGGCSACGVSGAGDQSFTYDGNGNLLSRTNALGNIIRFAYEPVFSRVTSTTDPLGNVTQFAYDARGNLTQITDANGNKTSMTYDPSGLVTAITDPLSNQASLLYDSLGNPVAITDPLGSSTAMLYDGVSRLIEVKDRLGRSSRAVYDKLDRVISSIDAKGQTTSFAYDAVSNLLSLTDARRGPPTSFSYDNMNRLVKRTTPGGRMDTRKYDLNGNLIEFTDRRGQTSVFEYDALDRLTRETYQDGSSVIRQYDPRGRLLQVDDSRGGVFSFDYDLAGRQRRAAGPFGTVLYTPDARGRVDSRQVVGQSAVSHTYDKAGNLLTASSPQASVSFAYDARNQLVGTMRSNGVSSSYSYDRLGRLLSIAHSRGAAILNSQTYSYDAVGNRTNYSTNIAQPLVTQPFTATYDNENRLLTRDSVKYAYDENGNRISETGPGGASAFTWDSRNRLQSLTLPGGQTVMFRYDFAGNMIEKQVAGAGANSIERFVLDNLTNVVFQADSSGQQMSILTGRSIDSHFAAIRPDGQVDFGIEDGTNSTVATTNQAGLINGQLFYEPYGETTTSGSGYPFQFTGRVPVSGQVYYYRARFFDPEAGRFMSEDPLETDQANSDEQGNLYRYVKNNPTNYVDPSGNYLNPIVIKLGASILVAAIVWLETGGFVLHLSEPFEFAPPEDEICPLSEEHEELPKPQPHTHEEEQRNLPNPMRDRPTTPWPPKWFEELIKLQQKMGNRGRLRLIRDKKGK